MSYEQGVKPRSSASSGQSAVEKGRVDVRENIYREDIDTSSVDERKLIRKIDMRLIPWLSLLYLLSFLDRTSIGNAKVCATSPFARNTRWIDFPTFPVTMAALRPGGGLAYVRQAVSTLSHNILFPLRPLRGESCNLVKRSVQT